MYLKAWDEHDHHSVVLRQAETPGMDYYGFKVDSKATLDELAKAVSGFGCKVESIPAGEHRATGERVRFPAPTGHHIELYAEKKQVGNGIPLRNPDPWPEGLKGMAGMARRIASFPLLFTTVAPVAMKRALPVGASLSSRNPASHFMNSRQPSGVK